MPEDDRPYMQEPRTTMSIRRDFSDLSAPNGRGTYITGFLVYDLDNGGRLVRFSPDTGPDSKAWSAQIQELFGPRALWWFSQRPSIDLGVIEADGSFTEFTSFERSAFGLMDMVSVLDYVSSPDIAEDVTVRIIDNEIQY